MTLILTCLTPTLVIQVSDRRLSWLTGPKAGQPTDVEQNKSVVVCNRICFAYSGPSNIGGKRTDLWLTEVVARVQPYSLRRILEEVRHSAERELTGTGLRQYGRLAFVAAGWAKRIREGQLEAIVFSIANALDDSWRWKRSAEDTFVQRMWPLSSSVSDIELIETGVSLGTALRIDVERQLRRCHEHSAGPEAFVRVLAGAIRR